MAINWPTIPAVPDLSSPSTFNSRHLAWLTYISDLATELENATGTDFVDGEDISPSGIAVGEGDASNVPLAAYSSDPTCIIALNDDTTSSNGAVGVAATGDLLQLRSDGAVRATFDGSYMGIGSTSPSALLFVGSSSTEPMVRVNPTNASYALPIFNVYSNRSASTDFDFAQYRSAGGAGDLEFRFSGDGNGTCDGSWTGGGADYAEYFEWSDGNQNGEDRRGVPVVLDGHKIRPALDGEEPFGAVSANPSVIGDGDIDRWKEKYLRDDYGANVFEDYEVLEWQETVTETLKVPEKNEKGKVTIVEKEFTETVLHSYAFDEIPEGVTVPANAKRTTQQRRKLNPDFDPSLEYVSRADRPEWAAIGLTGKLRIRKGRPVGANWQKMRDISKTVEEWLVK